GGGTGVQTESVLEGSQRLIIIPLLHVDDSQQIIALDAPGCRLKPGQCRLPGTGQVSLCKEIPRCGESICRRDWCWTRLLGRGGHTQREKTRQQWKALCGHECHTPLMII